MENFGQAAACLKKRSVSLRLDEKDGIWRDCVSDVGIIIRLCIQSDSQIHSHFSGGSIFHGGFDKYYDLDFIIVVDPIYYDEIKAQRRVLGGSWAICCMLLPRNMLERRSLTRPE